MLIHIIRIRRHIYSMNMLEMVLEEIDDVIFAPREPPVWLMRKK